MLILTRNGARIMSTFKHRLYFDTEVVAPHPGALNSNSAQYIGLDNYARHPKTRICLVAYAIDDGPASVWDTRFDVPDDFTLAWNAPDVQIVAHNAQFDRVVTMHKWSLVPPISRWYCTRACAYAHGLPGELDLLSKIFALGEDAKKAARGKELIELFCERAADPDEHPLEWLEFQEYALYDVIAMRELTKRMPTWAFGEFEQRVYHLDQEINDRGFAVDLQLAQAMIEASNWAQERLNARVQAITGGIIQKGTQRDKLKQWFEDNGLVLDNMQAETLRKVERDADAGVIEVSPELRELVQIRLLSAKSSIAKCRTLLNTVSPDGRIRYTVTYGGGGRNLRFSHKGFQPGNMPRPSRARKNPEQQRAVVEALKGGYATTIWGDETMAACADAIRGLIVAAPGKKLMSVDWSNIEGRKLAWYAGEEWKLKAYRDKDAGLGEDVYKIVFHRMTGTPFEAIDDFLRQQGKGADLSMGYEGGVGAYLNIAQAYQLDLVRLAASAPQQLPAECMARGAADWERLSKGDAEDDEKAADEDKTFGLPREIFIACAASKHAWRGGHPATVQLWQDLLQCAKAAVANPGKLFQCANGKVQMACDSKLDWLSVRIPSGRQIMFAKPRLRVVVKKDKRGREYTSESLTALKSPSWHRQHLYGGLLANAITQGGCRDILVSKLLRVAEAGFPIVMHIHDDVIAEVDANDPALTLERLKAEMLVPEPWYADLPLSASGFETTRLHKE